MQDGFHNMEKVGSKLQFILVWMTLDCNRNTGGLLSFLLVLLVCISANVFSCS